MKLEIQYRAPQKSEAQQVTDLVIASDVADFGQPDYTLEDLLDIWSTIDIRTDAVAAVHENGRIVGYAFLEAMGENRIDLTGVVHPEWRGEGIGSALMQWGDERVKEWIDQNDAEQGQEFSVNHVIAYDNPRAVKLAESYGYRFARLFCRMGIELDAFRSEQAQAPAGLRFRAYRPGQDDDALFAAYHHCFRGSWGFADMPFEKWIKSIGGERLAPELWTIAECVQDGSFAGFSLMNASEGQGFIRLLGVDQRWRQRGVGLALLRYSFELAKQAGLKEVLLGVDAENADNAKKLYEKAGMNALFTIGVFQKSFRK